MPLAHAPATSGMTVVVHWNRASSFQVNFPTPEYIIIYPVLHLEYELICLACVLKWECLLLGHMWYER